jgi:hypothetical protein
MSAMATKRYGEKQQTNDMQTTMMPVHNWKVMNGVREDACMLAYPSSWSLFSLSFTIHVAENFVQSWLGGAKMSEGAQNLHHVPRLLLERESIVLGTTSACHSSSNVIPCSSLHRCHVVQSCHIGYDAGSFCCAQITSIAS